VKFSREYQKLKNKRFTTIRKNSGYYRLGGTYKIVSPTETFKVAVIGLRPITKKEITDEFALPDADCTAVELIKMLEKWYGKTYDDFVILRLERESK